MLGGVLSRGQSNRGGARRDLQTRPGPSADLVCRVTFNYSACRGARIEATDRREMGTVSSFESIHQTITPGWSRTQKLDSTGGTTLKQTRSAARRLHVNDVPRCVSTKKALANYR